jgi:chromosome segregation ATPase
MALTYEEFSTIAKQLETEGIRASAGKVRDRAVLSYGPTRRLGASAMLQEFMDRYRSSKPLQGNGDNGPAIPSMLAQEIGRALAAASVHGRDDLTGELEVARTEIAELVVEAKALGEDVAALSEQLTVRTGERDALQGQMTVINTEIVELRAGLARERAALLEVQLDLARAQITTANAMASQKMMVDESAGMRTSVETLRLEIEGHRRSRADAERRADVALARLESETNARATAEGRIGDLLGAVQGIDTATSRAASAEAANSELRAQVSMLKGLLDRSGGQRARSWRAAPSDVAR